MPRARRVGGIRAALSSVIVPEVRLNEKNSMLLKIPRARKHYPPSVHTRIMILMVFLFLR